MPMVPEAMPSPQNRPSSSNPDRSLRVAYQIAPKMVTACNGNQMMVMARYQKSWLSGVSVSGFSVFSPTSTSRIVVMYHAYEGSSMNHQPPLTVAMAAKGIRPSDSQNGKALAKRERNAVFMRNDVCCCNHRDYDGKRDGWLG